MKPGRIFEELVFVLTKGLHERAAVKFDDHLVDKDTGKLRQIDISVRVTEGPTSFLVIIEARERSRPVGVGYVEEVKSKAESVGADRAVIVSNRGFGKNALIKAKSYRIETYSLQDAMRENWSETISQLRGIIHHSIGANVKFYFLADNDSIINPCPELIARLRTEAGKAVLVEDTITGEVFTAGDILNLVFEKRGIPALIDSDPQRRHSLDVHTNIVPNDKWTFRCSTGARLPFRRLRIQGEVWRKTEIIPIDVEQYSDEINGTLLAEVIKPSVTSELGIELIITNPGSPNGSQILIRKARNSGN